MPRGGRRTKKPSPRSRPLRNSGVRSGAFLRSLPSILRSPQQDWVVRYQEYSAFFVPRIAELVETDFPALAMLSFTPKPFLVQMTSDVPWFGVAYNYGANLACVVERRFGGITATRSAVANEVAREPLLLAAEQFEASMWGEGLGQRPVICAY
jgi:hypothetical protein